MAKPLLFLASSFLSLFLRLKTYVCLIPEYLVAFPAKPLSFFALPSLQLLCSLTLTLCLQLAFGRLSLALPLLLLVPPDPAI